MRLSELRVHGQLWGRPRHGAVLIGAFLLLLACRGALEGIQADEPRVRVKAVASSCAPAGNLADLAPAELLGLAECEEARGELQSALNVVRELDERYALDEVVMRSASERLQSLLLQRVTVLGVPTQLSLSESSIPLPMLSGSVGRRRGLFLWDSGAETTAFDSAFCSDLGLLTFGAVSAANAAGETIAGYQVAILGESIVLGSIESSPAVACIDLSSVKAVDPRVAGILGGNLLRSNSYELNLAERWIRIGGPLPREITLMKGEFSQSRPYLWVELDGHATLFLLDTGAATSTVSQRSLDEMGRTPRSLGDTSNHTVVGGKDQREAQSITFRHVRSGQEEREGVRFSVGELNLVGWDFIGEKTLVVDHDARLIAFAPATED